MSAAELGKVAFIPAELTALELVLLPLEWRCVDFVGHEVTLEPGTTKNDDARRYTRRYQDAV